MFFKRFIKSYFMPIYFRQQHTNFNWTKVGHWTNLNHLSRTLYIQSFLLLEFTRTILVSLSPSLCVYIYIIMVCYFFLFFWCNDFTLVLCITLLYVLHTSLAKSLVLSIQFATSEIAQAHERTSLEKKQRKFKKKKHQPLLCISCF